MQVHNKAPDFPTHPQPLTPQVRLIVGVNVLPLKLIEGFESNGLRLLLSASPSTFVAFELAKAIAAPELLLLLRCDLVTILLMLVPFFVCMEFNTECRFDITSMLQHKTSK